MFLCKTKLRYFPSSKSDFTFLWSENTGPHSSLTSCSLSISQPVRTHSLLPLWWLALAKEMSHLPLLKSGQWQRLDEYRELKSSLQLHWPGQSWLAYICVCHTWDTWHIFPLIFLNTCSIYTTGIISYLRLLQSYTLLHTTETITSWNLCATIEVNSLGYVQACHTKVLSFHNTITKTCKGFFLTVVQNVLSSRN